jgi:hypothetical protein
VPSQQPKGHLQTQHSLDTGKHSLDTGKSKIKDKHWLKKIIQFNSIYLRANLTAERPITK